MFINDLPDEAADGVKTAVYANNTKLYQNVLSIEHSDLIEVTLPNMHDWSQRNNIRFNTSKCKALTVTRKKSPIVFDYTILHCIDTLTIEYQCCMLTNHIAFEIRALNCEWAMLI